MPLFACGSSMPRKLWEIGIIVLHITSSRLEFDFRRIRCEVKINNGVVCVYANHKMGGWGRIDLEVIYLTVSECPEVEDNCMERAWLPN